MVGSDATLTVEKINPSTGIPQYQQIPLFPEPTIYLDKTDLQSVIPGHDIRAILERDEKSLRQPPSCVYRFHIVNLEKGGSTFNDGMRPLVYFETAPTSKVENTNPLSQKEWRKKWYPPPPPIPGLEHIVVDDDDDDELEEIEKKKLDENKNNHIPTAKYIPSPATPSSYHVPTLPGSGWRRAGFDIVYYRNQYTRMKERINSPIMDEEGSDTTPGTIVSYQSGGNTPNNSTDETKPTNQYSQTWSISFPSGVHTAFFAYCFPYTYSDLRRDMVRWENRAVRLSSNNTNTKENIVPICEWDTTVLQPEIDNLHYDDMNNDTINRLSKQTLLNTTTSLPTGTILPDGYTIAPQPFSTRLSTTVPLSMPIPIGTQFMSNILHRSILCTSLAGNPVPLLTITDFTSGPAALAARPYIVLSARVHPGETNGSWMMRGVIDMLTSSAPIAVELRKRIIFKIVPFLNPDGVINGHHRTGLAGLDLNRHWTNPDINKAPTIWHLRTLLMSIQSRASGQGLLSSMDTLPLDYSIPNDIQLYNNNTNTVDNVSPDVSIDNPSININGSKASINSSLPILPPIAQPCIFFCDFHGHSRRRNVFTFGCHELPYSVDTIPPANTVNTNDSNSNNPIAGPASRTFPKLLASRIDTFAYGDCSWRVQKDKANCARVAMWRDALLTASYTIEASFAGPDTGTQKGIHFTTRQYEEVGYAFVAALLDFVEGPIGTRMNMAVQRLRNDNIVNANNNTNTKNNMNDENVNNTIGNETTNTSVTTSTTITTNNTNTKSLGTINNNINNNSKGKSSTDSAKPSLLKKIGRKKAVQDAEIIIYGGTD